jgi:Tol biopolymer transport system component
MHGFSPDGQTILFSGVEEGQYYYDMEIYVMDLATQRVTRLTENDEWDEHAHFSPDGRYIVWMSSEGISQPKGDSLTEIVSNPPRVEYWIMKSDGSDKRRISGFNHPDEPDYIPVPGGVGLGDLAWGPDGKTIVAKMRRGRGQEVTVLVEFNLEDYL